MNAGDEVATQGLFLIDAQAHVSRDVSAEQRFVLADIPGLIEGAAEGAGIGDRFLGHVERCKLLLHLVDAAGEDPVEAWRVVREELDAYGAGLAGKPEILAASRSDLIGPKSLAKVRRALEKASGVAVLPVSAATSARTPREGPRDPVPR